MAGGGLKEFALDFGISISKGTLTNVAALGTGLTAAYGIMKMCANIGDEIATSLKRSALAAGGYAQRLRESADAMQRYLKGGSFFDSEDQLQGMEMLRQKGVDLQKTFEFINKSAHATGRTFTEFSSMISSAIAGNSHALVEAGLMTERSARMFDKYTANTNQRKEAIMGFLKGHKGIMKAIKEDFMLIGDYLNKIPIAMQSLRNTLVGRPNDPESLYASCVKMAKVIHDYFMTAVEGVKKYFWGAGQVLAWYVRKVTEFIEWVAKKMRPHLDFLGELNSAYKEQVRSFIVWLEFWKVKLVKFFREYKTEILTVVGALFALKAANKAWALVSVASQNSVIMGMQNLARNAWEFVTTNPWVIAIAAVVAILVMLYKKFAGVRVVLNGISKITIDVLKFIGNLLTMIVQGIVIAIGFLWDSLKRHFTYLWDSLTNSAAFKWVADKVNWLWNTVLKPVFSWLGDALSKVWDWLSDSWLGKAIKKIGNAIYDNIIKPIKDFFSGDWWNKIMDFFGGGLSGVNDRLASANRSMGQLIFTGDTNGNNETVNKVFSHLGGTYKEGERDDTDYLSVGVSKVKQGMSSAFNNMVGKGTTVNIYNNNDIKVGGKVTNTDIDELVQQFKVVQIRSDRQAKLQAGK